jgi:hypothetical protein
VTNPSASFIRSPGTYNDGQWHNAVGVFNGTNNITFYVDGTSVGTLNITQPFTPPASYLRVGYMNLARFYNVFGSNFDGKPHIQSYFFNGSIDEATLHASALAPEQVAALYASGSAHGAPLPPEQADPGPPPPPPPPSSYPTTVMADTPSLYWRLNELAQGNIVDSSGLNRTGTYRNGVTYFSEDALVNGSDFGVISGSSGVGYSNSQQAAPTTYSIEAWVKTGSFNGGKILGYENAQTGWGTSFDRHLYMTNNGRIGYGIVSGGAQQSILSTTLFNNNLWHHVVATQGANGMALYVDGVLIGTNPTVTPDAYTGYWRLGGGNLTGWPSAPASSALLGSFDEAAVYPTELTAAQVAAHYAAASN